MKEENNLDYLLKVFVKSSIIVLIGVILSKIASYFYRAVIARNFGQEIYGVFSLAIAILSFFMAFLSLGLSTGLLRFIPFYRGKREINKIQTIFRFSLVLTLIASVAGGVLLFFLSETVSVTLFHTPGLTIFLRWFAVCMPLFIIAGVFHAIILAYEKIKWFSFMGNILSPIGQLILLVFFMFIGLESKSISLSYILGFFLVFSFSLLVCKYSIKEIFGKPDMGRKEKSETNRKFFSYSWPIMFSGLVYIFSSGIDSFSIGYLKTASDVGVYNAALPIAYFLLIVPVLFSNLFLPVISREYANQNNSVIKGLSKQIGKWIFILNLPLLIIMILFPGAAINILFGSEYLSAETALRFLSVGFFLYSILQLSDSLLSMAGKSKIILFNLIVSSIVNLILNLTLIPKYGLGGAAFATMISYIVWCSLSLFICWHYAKVNPLSRSMLKILLVSIIPTAALFYIKSKIEISSLSMIILGISFVILYFLLIVLTRCLDKNDLMIWKAVKNKFFKNKSITLPQSF